MFIIYKNISDFEKILTTLRINLGIQQDSDWLYILRKQERADGTTDTLIYIECMFALDVRSSTLTIDTVLPDIFCWSESDLFLRFILTFHGEFNINTDITTNFHEPTLLEHVVILQSLPELIEPTALNQNVAVPPTRSVVSDRNDDNLPDLGDSCKKDYCNNL